MPEAVAQASAGDEQHRVGDDVAGDHHLQPRAGGVQVSTQGRRGDVDDRDVEDRHELPDEQYREHRAGAQSAGPHELA